MNKIGADVNDEQCPEQTSVFILSFSGLESHPVHRGSCGSDLMDSCWWRWPLLAFSLWWWCCCWAATSTWCPLTPPPGSSCHATGSPTWRTVAARRTLLTVESSATFGISSASVGLWCGSKCTTEICQILSDSNLDGVSRLHPRVDNTFRERKRPSDANYLHVHWFWIFPLKSGHHFLSLFKFCPWQFMSGDQTMWLHPSVFWTNFLCLGFNATFISM